MKTKDWKTEADVMSALGALGHTAEHLAIFDDVDLLRQKLETFAPDVLFNLVEQFRNNPGFDQNIVSFFEMQGRPFTGCGSTGLTLCKHKGISKKILHYHGIHVPHFVVVPRGQRIGRPKQLKFPILVKPVKEEASYGISQASFVETDDDFRERVAFIHEKYNSDAIAEEYIEGRELYVSLMGNVKLTVFPIRELVFGDVPPNEPKLAPYKAKWDEEYCSRFVPNLRPRRIARAHHRRACPAPRQLRQSNPAVPTENNSGARISLAAAQALGQKNQSLQPRRSFDRIWQRVSHPRAAGDDKRAQPSQPFVPSQTGRRKPAAVPRYVMSPCVAVGGG